MADAATMLELETLPSVHPAFGRVLSTHEGRPLAGGIWFYFGGLAVIGAISALVDWVGDLIGGYATVSGLLTVFAVLAIAALVGLRCVYLWRQRLGIYEGGFVIARIGKTRAVAWSEIENVRAIRERDSLGHRFVIDVELRDGGTVTLTDALDRIEGQTGIFQNRGGLRG